MTKKTNIELVEAEEVKPVSDVITHELVKHNLTEALLLELENSAAGLEIRDINDKENYDAVNKLRIAAKNTRVMTTKVCKTLREDSIAFQKEVIKKEKEITERIEKVEESLAAKQAIVDAEKDRIKKEKEIAEQQILQERAVKLIESGCNFTGDAYVIDDIRISLIQVKSSDNFTWTVLFSAVEQRFKTIQEVKAQEEKLREEAAANAKLIIEQQKAREEEFKLKEAELQARQKAIEEAEAKAKFEAEEKIRLEQEVKIKAEQDRIKADQKALEEKIKSRKSALFALGFSSREDYLAFKDLHVSFKDIQEISDEVWQDDLIIYTKTVNTLKEQIEQERLTEITRLQEEAVVKERARIEAEIKAESIKKAAEQETRLAEDVRLKTLEPDSNKFDEYLTDILTLRVPEFTSSEYAQSKALIQDTITKVVQFLKTKKP